MSEWCNERTVNFTRLVPLVDGPAFQHATCNDPIVDVLMIDDGGNLERGRATLRVAKRALCGKPYSAWPDFNITFDDPKQPNARNQRRRPA